MSAPHRPLLVLGGESVSTEVLVEALHRLGFHRARGAVSAETLLEDLAAAPAEMVVLDEAPGAANAASLARKIMDVTGLPVVFVGPGTDGRRFHRLREIDPFGFVVLPLRDEELRVQLDLAFHRLDKERERRLARPARLEAHERLREGEAMLPLCAGCKRITDEDGRWLKLEEYFAAHAGVTFTHSLCPECEARLYSVPQVERVGKAGRTA